MQLIRFRVDLAPQCSLGPGKIALLEAVAKQGSLTKAAARLGYSYRYAWLLLDDLNRCFDEPVTRAMVGGRRGGGVELTKFGAKLIQRYQLATRRIDAVGRSAFGSLKSKVRARRAAKPGRRKAARSRVRSIKSPS
jgi:molybdate transport system regulatory protein